MGETYLFWKGLTDLAKESQGNEKIFIGIRPFGFHAGNELTLFTYPFHLCSELKKLGKTPRFTFYISINDMEPHSLKYLFLDNQGKPFYKHEELTLDDDVPFEYNVFPRDTSFQYTSDKENCCESIVDHWEKIIKEKLLRLKVDFPEVEYKFIRNSSIKNKEEFVHAIKTAINSPEVLGNIVDKYNKVCFEDGFLVWSGMICPDCFSAQGRTTLENDLVKFSCTHCGKKSSGTIEENSFWMHHVFLLPPRLKIFDVDICIRGYDHYQFNQIPINEQLFSALFKEKLDVKTLVPPMIVGSDGKKMSKTWSNEKVLNTEKLKELSYKANTDKIIVK